MPLPLPFSSEATIAAVGPELTSTASLLKENKCYLTQHLGDIESPEALAFLDGSIKHLMKLLRVNRPDAVACDLHPRFLSKTVASQIAEQSGARLVETQHHHAHMASLMAESDIEPGNEVVSIICDGYGYGSDGAPWGGEILVGSYDGFQRAGHLEAQPMPGGDLSAIRYGRMLQGILSSEVPREELGRFLSKNCKLGFSKGEQEIEIVFNQLEKGIYTPLTTSAGRLLDAVSCLLDISHVRTYEGEGAMKLEAAAASVSSTSVELPIDIQEREGTHIFRTSNMVRRLMELKNRYSKADLAYAFHRALAEGLADMALRIAGDRGLGVIGFSGGVANNDIMTGIIRKRVEKEGLRFLRHRKVPCGDGGLSLGQAAIAAFRVS